MIVALAFSPFSDFVWLHGPTFFIDKRSILTMHFVTSSQVWKVTNERGVTEEANFVISGVGALHVPLKPDFKDQVPLF